MILCYLQYEGTYAHADGAENADALQLAFVLVGDEMAVDGIQPKGGTISEEAEIKHGDAICGGEDDVIVYLQGMLSWTRQGFLVGGGKSCLFVRNEI